MIEIQFFKVYRFMEFKEESSASAVQIPPAVIPSLEVIFGCMFSGKSSMLMQKIRLHRIAKRNCLLIKHTFDAKRYSKDSVASHDGVTLPSMVVSDLMSILSTDLEKYTVIGIDEAQFFKDLKEFVLKYFLSGKTIIVAGLDLDADDLAFGQVLTLVPFAKAIQLTAICQVCLQSTATLSKRISDSTEKILIGSTGSYIAICFYCKYKGCAAHCEPLLQKA